MTSVEEDFPRGGTAKKSSENKVAVQRTEVDTLFQVNEQSHPKKRKGTPKEDKIKVKKQKPGKEKESPLMLNAAPKCVEILHLKNVKEGMLMLGCVKEVMDFVVTVSLPSGLQGFLSIRNICDSYTTLLSEQVEADDLGEICTLPQLFFPGMLLRCVVHQLRVCHGGSVGIQLSINPKDVNKALTAASLTAGMVLSGCVSSVEDHVYIIDLGVSGTKGLLPKKMAQDKHNNVEELKVGQYVTPRVEEVKNEGRVVRLSHVFQTVSQAASESLHGWNVGNLLPGLRIKAAVQKVTKHGLLLNFMSDISGQVDFLHTEPEHVSSYTEGGEVEASVLYVEPSTRQVGLSLRSFLVHPGSGINAAPPGGDRVGEVVNGCKMVTVYQRSGAVLELPDSSLVFVHKNHLKEPAESTADPKLQNLPEHTCRILDFSLMDQIHFVTLRRSVIEKPFYRYHDLEAGQVVEGTVSVLLHHGMMVQLSDHIKGLVPRNHLSDITLKNPEMKYKEGKKVQCRVLSVEADKKRLYLTRKSAMIESSLPLFLSFEDARPGRVSHGYIVCVKDFGCIVRFYNNVKGLVPLRELSSDRILNPEELFYVGQVLKTRVLHCDPEKEKLVLSFKAALQSDAAQPAASQSSCEVGEKLEATILKKSANTLEMTVAPGGFRAVLPTMHLSDHMSNCRLLWEILQDGDTISDLTCFSKNKHSVIVTKKPAVRWSLDEGLVAKEFADITVGLQLIGWIKNIMSYGVFVEFPFGLVGLAPKSAMSDTFLSDTTSAFQVGQTVVAKVTNLDEEKRRFLVTLKMSEVMFSEVDNQRRLLHGVQERRSAAEMLTIKDGSDLRRELSALRVGQKMKLTVDAKTEGGASFTSDDLIGASILASEHHVTGVTLSSGQKVTAIVLHVDIMSSSVHVSTLPQLVGQKKSLSEGSKCTGTVQHVDGDFAVISLDDKGHVTVIQSAAHLNQIFLSDSPKLEVGTSLSVDIMEPSCEELEGLPLVLWECAAPKRRILLSETGTGSKHCFGDIVRGKVRSVKPTYVKVVLDDGTTGWVHVSQIVEAAEIGLGSFPTSTLKVGSTVRARVIGGREATSHRFLPFSHPRFIYTFPELSVLPSKLDESVGFKPTTTKEKLSSYKVGMEIVCFVSKFNSEKKSLEVTTDPSVTGTVELLSMTSDPRDANHPEKLYKLGQAVRAKVVEVVPKSQRLILSLNGLHLLQKDSVTLGMVTKIWPRTGLLVKLPFGGLGTVSITDLADAYKPHPLAAFKDRQLLRCFLLGKEGSKWQASLRPSRLNPEREKSVKDPEVLSVEELKVGQLVRGFIKSVGEQGVFIRLSRCLEGRAQLQKSTKYFVPKCSVLNEYLPPSTLITAKITSIDGEKELVDLSLLPEDTGKSDVLPESLNLPLRLTGDQKEKSVRKRKNQQETESNVPKKKKKKVKKKPEDSDSGVDAYFREDMDEDEEDKGPDPGHGGSGGAVGPSRLQVSAGFSWDVGLSALKPAAAVQEEEEDDEEEEQRSSSKRKTRHELELEKKVEEKVLVQREAELLDPTLRPGDAAAFERLLLASPNSSLLWLQYMAQQLQATQIDQARAVAERALKTISFREEQEKLNVWVALMNLENMYGTPEDLKKVFERALQFCDPVPVYQQLADIYAKSHKDKEAENLYKSMVKRFRQNKSVWLSYGTFLLQRGQSDAASVLLQRALKSLHSKESVDIIAKFAQLEFQVGDPEKGRTMFDKVLTSYPKRTDLWSVFIDLTIKHGSQDEVRALFDRVIHLSVSVKKIKFFFKRYLDYEKKHGSAQSVQAVKAKAMEFVEMKGVQTAS